LFIKFKYITHKSHIFTLLLLYNLIFKDEGWGTAKMFIYINLIFYRKFYFLQQSSPDYPSQGNFLALIFILLMPHFTSGTKTAIL